MTSDMVIMVVRMAHVITTLEGGVETLQRKLVEADAEITRLRAALEDAQATSVEDTPAQ